MPGSLAELQGMRQLQRLHLSLVGSKSHPMQLEDMPHSLTYLSFGDCTVSCPANTSGGFKLGALQELTVSFCKFTEGSLPAWAFTPRVHKVFIHSLQQTYSAAAWAALTASSKLESLELVSCSLPAGAAQRMFTAANHLPELHTVAIDMARPLAEVFDALKLSPSNLANLAVGSPNLRKLSVVWADTNISRKELQLLQQLTGLTKLSVAGPAWDDDTVEAVLAGMSGEHYCPRAQ
jgi:hypothetical protein